MKNPQEPKQELERGITITHVGKQETLEEASKRAVKSGLFKDETLFVAGVKWQQQKDKNKYSEEEMFEFSQWISHEDWVYLPSKGYWVNEEQEELEENFTTKELFEQFKKR